MIPAPEFAAWFAFWNCARGRQIFNIVHSTVLGRLISTAAMSLLVAWQYPVPQCVTMFLFCWLALMVWCTPAWDDYWSAEIGNDLLHSRWWGLWHMAARMTLAAPCIAGIALIANHPQNMIWAAATPLLALPYWLFGWFLSKKYVIPVSECGVGAILGLLVFFSLAA